MAVTKYFATMTTTFNVELSGNFTSVETTFDVEDFRNKMAEAHHFTRAIDAELISVETDNGLALIGNDGNFEAHGFDTNRADFEKEIVELATTAGLSVENLELRDTTSSFRAIVEEDAGEAFAAENGLLRVDDPVGGFAADGVDLIDGDVVIRGDNEEEIASRVEEWKSKASTFHLTREMGKTTLA